MSNQRGFILPSFFMSPTGIMATAIAVLVLTNFITYKLWRSEVAEYAQFRTDVETQSALLKAETERNKAESARVDAETARGWESAVQHWKSRADRVVTVRVPANCNQGALPAVPGATEGAGRATEEPRSGATVDVAECESRLNKAVLDAAQVEWVRSWVSNQRRVGQ